MLTLEQVKKNPFILEFISQTERAMEALFYTNHGIRHCNVVSERAKKIAKDLGLPEQEQELAAIAGFCHDMGNFLSRTFHNYLAPMIFQQIFSSQMEPAQLAIVMQAIAEHDKAEMSFTNAVSAVLVLADKSDVDRSRVTEKNVEKIKTDIHDRVNYATNESEVKISREKKMITLTLKIDTNFVPIMEYFEIFTERMVFCRLAAEFLGYKFGLVINSFRLL